MKIVYLLYKLEKYTYVLGVFIDYILWLIEHVNPVLRVSFNNNKDRYHSWKSKLVGFDGHTPSSSSKKILVCSFGTLATFPYEMVMVSAFKQAGYDIVISGANKYYLRKLWREMGVHYFTFLYDIQKKTTFYSYGSAKSTSREFSSVEQLIKLMDDEVQIGKYGLSSLLRKMRISTINVEDKLHQNNILKYIEISRNIKNISRALVKTYNPSIVLMYDRGYTPYGELSDVCINNGSYVVTMNSGHRNNLLLLKRYGTDNFDQHPSSLSNENWQYIKNMKWSDKKRDIVVGELYDAYNSGEWYAEVGTQFDKNMPSSLSLKNQLQLDINKKTAIIFPHILWDATFFWGEDLFANYEEWFVETVRQAVDNDSLNWIIKIHPGNVVKDRRDGVSGDQSEVVAIKKYFGELPKHVKLISADSDTSTYSLFGIVDYCLTVRGTVGIEAAMFGVTVLTAGTGRYDKKGFTIDSDSYNSYLDKVKNIESLPKMSKEQIELAQKFAYGIFVCRPVQLTSISAVYDNDQYATLNPSLNFNDAESLCRGSDSRQIVSWINSGKGDYIQGESFV